MSVCRTWPLSVASSLNVSQCILEWSNVTNKCPQCKCRFHTIKAVKELRRNNSRYNVFPVVMETAKSRLPVDCISIFLINFMFRSAAIPRTHLTECYCLMAGKKNKCACKRVAENLTPARGSQGFLYHAHSRSTAAMRSATKLPGGDGYNS